MLPQSTSIYFVQHQRQHHSPSRETFTFSPLLVTVMHSSPPNTTVSGNEDHHKTHPADVNATKSMFFLYLNIYWFAIFIVYVKSEKSLDVQLNYF